ncbi:MAG: tetratricopeptide repeat protein [Kofleriaceae bacterium]|jgi:tetratricopeptide (TPR) repeat protein|nr:tetratricopeptide repeat protein [Kofleriaceae bacterium]MBP9171613.1 tetratricopeptide repeat protein [Kofleriaceae bacterium]MBP9858952.1 tetratricopeptide repeat protein [Kofleriaceae bacterium]
MSQVARRYYTRGVAAIASGELTVAVEQLQAALELAPNFGDARIAFAVALAKFGDAPRAANVVRSGFGRTTSPVSLAALQATLGDVLTLSGDFLGAEEAFRQAGAHPDFAVRAASGLARVYMKLGRYRDAVGELRRAVR